MDLIGVWGVIRGLIRGRFSFNEIKELAGASGLPLQKLSHLQQRPLPARSATKGELLDAVDGLLNEEENPDLIISLFIKEMLRRDSILEREINEMIRKFGFVIQNGELQTTQLQVDISAKDLRQEIQGALNTCSQRYLSGDYSGTITCICGAVDSVTAQIYKFKRLGEPHDDSYQQRVNKGFASFECEFKSEFDNISAVNDDEVIRIWQNYRGAINQSAYVLASFRRNISDVHGLKDCPREFVQKALDCGTFILRSMMPYLESA